MYHDGCVKAKGFSAELRVSVWPAPVVQWLRHLTLDHGVPVQLSHEVSTIFLPTVPVSTFVPCSTLRVHHVGMVCEHMTWINDY